MCTTDTAGERYEVLLARALACYAKTHSLEITWRPRREHVYEAIKQRHPHFSWTYPNGRASFRFHDYPLNPDGSHASLYQLVTGSVRLCSRVVPVYPTEKPRRKMPRGAIYCCG
jgi:hypothetical protein